MSDPNIRFYQCGISELTWKHHDGVGTSQVDLEPFDTSTLLSKQPANASNYSGVQMKHLECGVLLSTLAGVLGETS